jgi:hypothetical protein
VHHRPVSEPAPTPPLRIGTAERDAAMAALDTHLEAGRLDPVEYGERSARVTDARTVDDLLPLFDDLPAPHPALPGVRATALVEDAGAPPAHRESAALQRWGIRVAAAMPILALVLFLTIPIPHAWLFFLLIPLAGALVRPRDRDRDRRSDDG